MRIPKGLLINLFAIVTICLFIESGARAQEAHGSSLTKDQIKQFLLTANVIASKSPERGDTPDAADSQRRETTSTHDASYQPIDEHKAEMKLGKWARRV